MRPEVSPRSGNVSGVQTTLSLTHLQRRLLGAQDSKLRRCWHCGEWVYDVEDCKVCAAPASKAALPAPAATA